MDDWIVWSVAAAGNCSQPEDKYQMKSGSR